MWLEDVQKAIEALNAENGSYHGCYSKIYVDCFGIICFETESGIEYCWTNQRGLVELCEEN